MLSVAEVLRMTKRPTQGGEYFDRIAENPYSFPSVDIILKGYHKAAYDSDSIYYQIANNTIEIMAI